MMTNEGKHQSSGASACCEYKQVLSTCAEHLQRLHSGHILLCLVVFVSFLGKRNQREAIDDVLKLLVDVDLH